MDAETNGDEVQGKPCEEKDDVDIVFFVAALSTP